MTIEAIDGVSPDESELLRARVRDLETALNQNNLDIAVTFQLTPALSNLLGLLLALPVATSRSIQRQVEVVTDPKVAIHRLRKAMDRWRDKLSVGEDEPLIHGRRHVGYWIEPDVKERMTALIAKHAPVTQKVTDESAA